MEQLAHILGRLPQGVGDDRARTRLAQAAWLRVAGEALAAHSRIVEVRRGYLKVAADGEAWTRELSSLSATLVSRLRAEYPALRLRRMTVHTDPACMGEAQPERAEPDPESAAPTDEITRRSQTIRDPALREALLRTAGAYLARRRRNG